MIVRSVRVGIPVQEAIRTVAREQPYPTGPEFSRLVSQVSVGVAMDEAMLDVPSRRPARIPFLLHGALAAKPDRRRAERDAGNFRRCLRKRAALKAKGMAMTSEAKATAAVLAALPVLIALVLWALDPQVHLTAVQ